MRNFLCFTAFLCTIPALTACDYFNYSGEDPYVCYVKLSWNGREFRGRDDASSIKKARKDAIEEACERACRRSDDCEKICRKTAEITHFRCRDRRTGDDVPAEKLNQ